MCMIALRVEVVILPHRCTPSCCGPFPLDELAARLRAEMRYGRDYRSTASPDLFVGMAAAFYHCPERN
ncbi:MAG: hypothetical protein PHO07_20390 [Pirellulales bacterium]|jgi:hypothetical protein|nr:hypothetical protein [Thermoguttaceae bacterium]MDD4789534.1 hypothetical protein [Pirellulales bacterium]